ncbi:granulocyte colony-stimulating factor-like [Cheilinus undulatus]|uniref:granulocyte colony-stimulating factor-like n=1 Tax=Cheilinus undulatus TaxID=241271 RepID=UPI001BD6BC28|nr:granulocyte colony-stimulating factor-like [Cheilinus undulatus]
MNTFIVAAVLHVFLCSLLVQSAPISSPSDLPPAFREAAAQAKTLVEKILRDIPAVHGATVNTEGLTLDPSTQTENLQMMATTLRIPAAPVLKPLSERFTLDVCVSRMAAGSRLYQGLLGVLSESLDGLTDLQADLRDLLMNINKMKEAAQLSSSSEDQNLDFHPQGNFEVQVAIHLTLKQLRSFCHDLIRSLRAVRS